MTESGDGTAGVERPIMQVEKTQKVSISPHSSLRQVNSPRRHRNLRVLERSPPETTNRWMWMGGN